MLNVKFPLDKEERKYRFQDGAGRWYEVNHEISDAAYKATKEEWEERKQAAEKLGLNCTNCRDWRDEELNPDPDDECDMDRGNIPPINYWCGLYGERDDFEMNHILP